MSEPRSDAPPAPTAPPPAGGARATSRAVKVADATAGVIVRVGGLAVIVAVVGILAFLVAVVLPLFRGARVSPSPSVGQVPVDGPVTMLAMDEYRLLAAAVGGAPEIVLFRPDDPTRPVARVPVAGLEGTRVTAARLSVRSHDLVLGTADGRLAFLRLGFTSAYVVGAPAEALRARIPVGRVETVDGAVVRRTSGATLLRVGCDIEVRGQVPLPRAAAPVVAASYASHEGEGVAAAVGADGVGYLVRQLADDGEGGGPAFRVETPAPGGPELPRGLFDALVDEELRTAWFVARDGVLHRTDVHARPARRLEVRRTGVEGGPALTAFGPVLGDRSLLLADASGEVTVWSPVPLTTELSASRADPGDGRVTERLHRLDPFPSPVTTVRSCPTRRTVYLGHEDGSVSAVYTVNDRVLARVDAFRGPVEALAVGPKDDGLLVAGPGAAFRAFDVEAPHPETNVRALFLPVRYEGYADPQLRYESSAGSDEAEPKLSLTPLLFGTAKATFYAMLFALPLALLGALYTSQFMHPKVRAVVKPSVEVMASLPSVVLGFVAALVLAPAVEKVVPGVFAALLSLGVVGFLAGVGWYFLPSELRNGLGSWSRLGIAAVLVAAVGWTCVQSTPAIERALFRVELPPTWAPAPDGSGPVRTPGGEVADFRRWMDAPRFATLGELDSHEPALAAPRLEAARKAAAAGGPSVPPAEAAPYGAGTRADGLPLLRVTLALLGAVLGLALLPRALARGLPEAWRRAIRPAGLMAASVVVPAALLALLAPWVERTVFGGDFRWFLVGTGSPEHGIRFDPRNSLVVGIAMGFAVIPIVYTIAEDALSAIPDSLRSAALGCGASPWQAATRVVLPAAVPGIFSACMIGLGRAIGETMIVLMAAGGTAIMDLTIFNGFRTLSVNIATELPEAPVGGTLYRVLFLAGLLLFVVTFVLNTAAEAVRLRFRKRFKGL